MIIPPQAGVQAVQPDPAAEYPLLVPDEATPYSANRIATTAESVQRDADDLQRVFWRALGPVSVDIVDEHVCRNDAPSHEAQEPGYTARDHLSGR